ncbi:class I SAM-dependent methyltransferase [Chitinophaga rhizophila]|uniref:Methyltransferase domain-containing protein n=1 Tax=Chitinophaga rhizophila TaxID=2866212 RepID=A0ABS7G8A7_9BACT|nr:methyltransferase domain-containing protein [Chitinophaga rhizophila]MBW8683360.1 methyltransferase domain-containing protein [Chitinophaga rhizophila]
MEYKRLADIKRLQFIIHTLKQHLPEGATVLDVGCGNGIIARGLGKEGFNVYGIDVSQKAIEKARALTHIPNVSFDVVSAEQLVADGKRYHAVICSEVLEHLNHPEKLLEVLYKSLTDKGVLIVTVPNGMGPREVLVTKPIIALQRKDNWVWKCILQTKQLLGYKGTTVQSDADDLTHVQFFSKHSLETLAVRTRFRIVRFGKTNFIDDVFPFSFFTKKISVLQKWDAAIAEVLPYQLTGSFVTVWEKKLHV